MSTLNLKIFEIHVCNQRKNRYYSAVQNLFHDCRGAALCPFTALQKVYGRGFLTHCFSVNRYIAAWTHAGGIIIFLFLLGWNFHCCTWQIKQGHVVMGSHMLLAGTVGTITQTQEDQNSIHAGTDVWI